MTTRPVVYPARFAASRRVPHGTPLGSTPIAPLYVLSAHEKAVAPAAESVTKDEALRVLELPTFDLE